MNFKKLFSKKNKEIKIENEIENKNNKEESMNNQNLYKIGDTKKIEIKDNDVINDAITTATKSLFEEENYYNRRYGYYPYFQDNTKRPEKTEDNNTLSIVIFKQSFLDEIMRKCLPKAGGSEFQFHYRGLQLKIKKPDSDHRIVITIPTVFFNFNQEVSGASVHYDLREVAEISEQIKPVSQQLAKMYIKKLNNLISHFKSKGFEVRFIEEEIGSIHRHPGRFGFSATDLDDNPKSPGVIYRNKKAIDLVQVDSVLYCAESAELVTTETRIFNIRPVDEADEDKGVEGTVARTPTLCYIFQDGSEIKSDPFAEFFDEEMEEEERIKYILHQDKIDKEYKKFVDLIEDFVKEYIPAEAINPELIKQQISYWERYYGGSWRNSRNTWWSSKKNKNKNALLDAKEELTMELRLYEPVQEQDVEQVKEYLKDPEVIESLWDIYEYYKSKNNKLSIAYKGGAQLNMNSSGGVFLYKGKQIWSWNWYDRFNVHSVYDIYGGI